ncbi:MAG TPA: hypothetical protein ENN17_00055 [bacterium]|nr:hypothetical protein [bacterium]
MKEKHLTHKERLFFCLDALPEEDLGRIRDHLAMCESCGERVRDEQLWIRLVKTHPVRRADGEMLERVRARLHERLRAVRTEAPSAHRREGIAPFFRPGLSRALAYASVIFFCGIGVGYFGLRPFTSGPSSRAAALNALISRSIPDDILLSSIGDDPNRIEIRFQAIEEHVIRGRLDDPHIQEAVGYALTRAPRDNIRLAALDRIASGPRTGAFEKALLYSAEKDHNPGIRLKALQALNTLPVSDGIKQVLIRTFLHADHSGIRIEAANGLSRIADAGILPLIRQWAEQDEYAQYLLSLAPETDTRQNMKPGI